MAMCCGSTNGLMRGRTKAPWFQKYCRTFWVRNQTVQIPNDVSFLTSCCVQSKITRFAAIFIIMCARSKCSFGSGLCCPQATAAEVLTGPFQLNVAYGGRRSRAEVSLLVCRHTSLLPEGGAKHGGSKSGYAASQEMKSNLLELRARRTSYLTFNTLL